MHATLSSKGQITLPKEIRDRLGLDVGATLDFKLLPDDTITVRAIKPDARRVRGLLKSPHPEPLSVQAMDEGIEQHLRDRNGHPTQRRAKRAAKR